ncbi:hypothetical protein A8709_06230 [Paenibacillus pectinilyticus]|uniref:Uncharacterized protein n=1 Tax=Paenibacillus pectinilyticus TaxID=512399 RepID=A0A1C0ZT64_9BACL|nr:hypothetical protein [Paenibacillus pectinilyticus]OCT11270.1 hypothetical protein A8709_06230 [Paenibacillus pectinilyticus]
MWKKAVVLGLAGIGLQIALWASPGSAYEYADTPTEVADGIHIPLKVTLLEDIPYYVIPNALLNKAEGSFAPQTVDVIEAESQWSGGGNWWKIHTDIGDRWIKTAPWQIEVPPPTTLTLMDITPLYAKPSDKVEPTAALSPQDVTVVDAEKGWFRNGSGTGDVFNPMKWIKIHTTWLGDQWIHVKLDQIGTFHKADQMSYFSNVYYNLKPQFDYQTYQTDGTLSNQFLHITGKYRSVLGTYYQIETNEGTKWALSGGQPIAAESKTIKRTHPSALYTYPSQFEDEPKIIVTGDLTVFEKTYSEFPNSYGYEGDWYHVRTAQGEGWFNPRFAEPEDAVTETATLQLNAGITTLFRYPNTGIILNHGQLGPQTLHPVAAWTDPNGVRWFQINTFVGKAWIQIQPYIDRIVLKDRESDMQMIGDTNYSGDFYMNDQGVFTYGNDPIGYDNLQGEPFFDTSFLAGMYHYDIKGPDVEGWWTYTNTSGYAFQIKTGELQARTLWDGHLAKQVTLASAPVIPTKKSSPHLGLTDIRTLLGATTNVFTGYNGNKVVNLSAHQYNISNLQFPSIVENDHAQLSGVIYDGRYDETNSIVQTLQITVKNRDSNESSTTEHVAAMTLLYDLSYHYGLYDISLNQPLKPGMNHLTVVFKVGERILLQRDWDVTSSAK